MAEKNGSMDERQRIIGTNPVIWKAKSSIRGMVAELKSAANPAKPVIPLGAGDPAAHPHLFSKGRAAFAAAVSAAVTSALHDSYPPPFGLPSARRDFWRRIVQWRPEPLSLYMRRFPWLSTSSGNFSGLRAVVEYLKSVVKGCNNSRDHPAELREGDVFLTAGATQALQTAVSVLASSGGNILLPRPGFPRYGSACELAGVDDRYYDLLPARRWEADPNQIRELADARTLAIVVINPNNPTGAAFSAHHLLQIAEISMDLNIPIIADEVYGEMVFGEGRFVSMASFAHLAPIITIGSLSKRWMVPGWRLGWLAIWDSHDALQEVRKATEILMNLNPGPASVIQAAVPAILLDTKVEFHENLLLLLESCMETLFKGLEQIEAMKCYSRPQGSIFMMVEVDTSLLLGIESDMDFVKELMKEESVLVMPGSIVGLKNWIRLFFGLPADLLREACDRMNSFCKRRMFITVQ